MESSLPFAGLALALTLLATPLLRRLLVRAGLLDQPNREHKAHPRATPTLGGLAVILCTAAAVVWSGRAPDWPPAVFAACGVIFLVGALDDLLHLSPVQKLTAELLCAAAICGTGMMLPLGPGWIAVPATMLWLAACANGFNLTDGEDGLAALIGLAALAGFWAIADFSGLGGLTPILAMLGASLLGFLVYNRPPARIFLGDSGSLPLGFFLGLCGIAWARAAPDTVAASAPWFLLALPLGETALSATRRALRGDPVFRADRRHIHHRLADRGLTPVQLLLACGGYALAGAGVGAIVARSGASAASGFAIAGFACASFAGLAFLRYPELSCATGMLLRLRAPLRLADEIRVAELREALGGASDPDERWRLIVGGMRDLGFRQVRLLDPLGRPIRATSGELDQLERIWKLSVHLPDGEGTLEIDRGAADDGESLVSNALVETLRGAFAHRAPSEASAATATAAGNRRTS